MKQMFVTVHKRIRMVAMISLGSYLAMTNPAFSASDPAPVRVEVSQFGAKVNDGVDDREAFLKAFAECAKQSASVLVLEKGVYDIFQNENEPPATVTFFLENIPNLTIEGNGAELLARTWHPLFRIHDSVNLRVKDLTVDWNPIPHVAGEVIERDPAKRSFSVRLAKAYQPAGAHQIDLIVAYDPVKKVPRQVPTGENFLFTQDTGPLPEVVAPDVIRVQLGKKPRTVTPYAAKVVVPEIGTFVTMRYRSRGGTAFLFQRCDNLIVEGVNVYSAPGMGLNMLSCTDVRLKNVRVEERPGEDRWMSTNVDATHFNVCRGQVLIEDCVFNGQEDDGSNVHNMYMRLYAKKGPRVVELVGGRGYDAFQPDPDPRVGDVLEFGSEANPYVSAFDAKIVSVSSIPTRPDGKAKLFTVTLDRDVPDLPKDTVVGNASAVPDMFTMRRTEVRGNRGMGIRVQTRNALIEECLFEDISGAAIWLQCTIEKSGNSAEGVSNRNVVIRNNKIYRSGSMLGPNSGGIMMIVGRTKSFPYVHENITIENNLVEDSFGYGISVVSANGARVTGNTIINARNAPVFVGESKNVVVKDNVFFLKPDQEKTADVVFGGRNVPETIEVSGNQREIDSNLAKSR